MLPDDALVDVPPAACARRAYRRGCIGLALCLCLPLCGHAQSSASGTVAVSSQLVDRGIAVTGQTPVVQGVASLGFPSGWSLGLSASVEARQPDQVAEALAQAARAWSLSADWQMQASLIYYDYPGSRRARRFDRAEAGLSWSWRDVLTVGVSAIYPVGDARHRPRGAADVAFRWPLPWHLALSAGAGVTQAAYLSYHAYGSNPVRYEAYDRHDTYAYGHLGLLWSRGPWHVELDRIATSGRQPQRGWPDTAPWVATVSWSF